MRSHHRSIVLALGLSGLVWAGSSAMAAQLDVSSNVTAGGNTNADSDSSSTLASSSTSASDADSTSDASAASNADHTVRAYSSVAGSTTGGTLDSTNVSTYSGNFMVNSATLATGTPVTVDIEVQFNGTIETFDRTGGSPPDDTDAFASVVGVLTVDGNPEYYGYLFFDALFGPPADGGGDFSGHVAFTDDGAGHLTGTVAADSIISVNSTVGSVFNLVLELNNFEAYADAGLDVTATADFLNPSGPQDQRGTFTILSDNPNFSVSEVVPEPTAIALLGIGGLCLARRPRRHEIVAAR